MVETQTVNLPRDQIAHLALDVPSEMPDFLFIETSSLRKRSLPPRLRHLAWKVTSSELFHSAAPSVALIVLTVLPCAGGKPFGQVFTDEGIEVLAGKQISIGDLQVLAGKQISIGDLQVLAGKQISIGDLQVLRASGVLHVSGHVELLRLRLPLG
ncbi:hypothetical protein AK812_SmicGene28471 [Symbiodinium microadriaticum]|uniref:Uncharacterized protein n=1 Tax=Symbiodinium microadriaticum TaxID=2951 RepID=A0A1Q9D4C3_SYMMI|nr:hypothetical protein AK812_SmicGene28471 [Symbiodinium microadriaticum]